MIIDPFSFALSAENFQDAFIYGVVCIGLSRFSDEDR